MEDTLISFNTAILAKEKGFNIRCDNKYDSEGNILTITYSSAYPELIKAPTQSLLQRWLREVHDIHVNPSHSYTKGGKDLGYSLSIESNSYKYLGKYLYDYTYEEILEQGLFEALSIIKESKTNPGGFVIKLEDLPSKGKFYNNK